jgi:diketogulonate reductase-like aldo/keto reductase
MMSAASTIQLNDGNRIPIIGLGLYEAEASPSTIRLVRQAVNEGYRLFDTAQLYGNEYETGYGLKISRIPREQIFITTKLYTTANGRSQVLRSFRESLQQLNVDYVDLYLIHAPQGGHVLEAYDTLLELQGKGRIRSVGVSNFGVQHLEAIRRSGRPLPTVNQIELHPFTQQRSIVNYCRRYNIALMAYSPLARGSVLRDPFINQLARKYRRTPAQILIRWSIQNNFIPIPKTNQPRRLRENIHVFDFRLSNNDMRQLTDYGYQQEARSGWNPTNNDWNQFGPIY